MAAGLTTIRENGSATPPAVLILAAGRGQRMGRVKALLPLPLSPDGGDCSALAGLARLYRGCGLRDITVVCGFHGELVGEEASALGLAVVRNPLPEEGMFSSVRAGLQHLVARGTIRAVFIQPVDVPLTRPLTLMALMAAHKATREEAPSPPVLIPDFAGRQGHPPLIPGGHIPRILTHTGEDGLRGALESLPRRTLPVADALMLEDMDSPADHARLCRLARWRTALRPAEALALLRSRQVPEKGLAHARAVGTVAAAFATALTRARACRGEVAECRPWLALAGGLLHDIAKGQPQHEQAGAALLEQLGLPLMARLVRDHRDLSLPETAAVTERELVYLADKYCRGSAFAPLDERFGEKLRQFGDNAQARAGIAGRLERARHMQARLARETGRQPANLAREALEAGPSPAWVEDEA